MISLEELRELPEFKRLARGACITALLWLAAIIVFSFALSALRSNEERLTDAERVLNAAVAVRSYPAQSEAAASEPLAAVSAIVEKSGLQDRASQLSSSPAGLLLQINRLYPDELGKLLKEMQRAALSVKTAEIRAFSGQKDGRLLNVSITIEGEEK